MANEAATTIVLRMRDEASQGMENFGKSTEQAQIESLQLNSALTAMGGALTGVGSVLSQVGGEGAKTAAVFITTAGAILTTTSAIIQAIPYIRQLTGSLRNLAIVQGIVAALSGRWLALGIGAVVGGGIAYGVARATGPSGRPSSGTVVNNYIQGSVVTERQVSEMTRRALVINQSRNASSGLK